jgi:hypothetical protein
MKIVVKGYPLPTDYCIFKGVVRAANKCEIMNGEQPSG